MKTGGAQPRPYIHGIKLNNMIALIVLVVMVVVVLIVGAVVFDVIDIS